jgi:ubiquitin C-terminal hydrolase
MMKEAQQKAEEQIAALEKQIADCQDEIDRTFKHLDNEDGAYHLHAVCIHDGGATSGHYFTYIKDQNTGIWRKFSDLKVDVVDEK